MIESSRIIAEDLKAEFGYPIKNIRDVHYLLPKIFEASPLLSYLLREVEIYLQDKTHYGIDVETALVNTLENKIYISPTFLQSIEPYPSVGFVCFIVCHELLHLVYSHMERRDNILKKYNNVISPTLLNVANDYALNLTVEEFSNGKFKCRGFYNALYDENYKAKTAEEIYDILYKNHGLGKIKPEQIKPGYEGDTPLKGKLVDNHDGGDEDEKLSEINGKGMEKEQNKNRIQTAIQRAKEAGDGSAKKLDRELGLSKSKVSWKRFLRPVIFSMMKGDENYTKYNKRSALRDTILASAMESKNGIKIALAVDVSGSIGQEEAAIWLGELKGILHQFPKVDIDFWQFDTQVTEIQKIRNMEVFNKITLKQGGGTSLDTTMRRVRENRYKLLLIMTDGYVGSDWGGRPGTGTKVVALIRNGESRITPPEWIVPIYYDELV